MTTRDRTTEILAVKKRRSQQHGHASFALERLSSEWAGNKESKACVSDFYLIRAVTFLEVFTRTQVAALVDHAKEYTDRAVELSKHFKMDFATVRDVQGRAVTLGDIVGHSIPVNSFGQIFGYFETLLGKPLRPLIVGAVDRWHTEVDGYPSEPIIPDFDKLAGSLTRLFELRHILCHEVPAQPVYTKEETTDLLDSAIQFTKALQEILTFEKFGRVPLTQTDMNIAARDDLKKREEELDGLLALIREKMATLEKVGENWRQALDDAQEKWLAYRNAHCDCVTYLYSGGTIRPCLWGSEAVRLTQFRMAEIQSWFEQESKLLSFPAADKQKNGA